MDKNTAQTLIQAGLDKGADFVDIFEEETYTSNIIFKDKKVEGATNSISYGIGIRLIFGTEVFYTCSNNNDLETLLLLLNKFPKSELTKKSNFIHFIDSKITSKHKILIEPEKIKAKDKLEFLYLSDKFSRQVSNLIKQVSVSIYDITSNINIFNSNGLNKKDKRILSRYNLSVTSEKDNNIQVSRHTPGAKKGFEFIKSLNIEEIATKTAESSIKMLSAKHIEGKKMPVIIGNGFGGVIFHEACGHPLETESIRKNSSPFCGKLNQKIAHSKLTAYDDGTIENMWGSLDIDDEGMETEKTLLIEDGVLKNYLSDMIGAKELNLPKTGSARRESYHYNPVSRMRNTYIEKGTDKISDMLLSIDFGLYAMKMGGGSVNPATGEFNFSVEEAYAIKKGKIAEAVQGANLIGKGHEILPLISMVSDDLDFAAGMCGASSGSVPVTVGQPTIKVDEILVGGR